MSGLISLYHRGADPKRGGFGSDPSADRLRRNGR